MVRASDRQLRGRMMPPEEIIRAADLQRHVGADRADRRDQPDDREERDRGRHGRDHFDVSALRNRHSSSRRKPGSAWRCWAFPRLTCAGRRRRWKHCLGRRGGLLRVGPHSAGARPGPACYGRGGTEPTVTDANVVLGIIDPDYFLGGRSSSIGQGGGRHRRIARRLHLSPW